MTKLKEENKKQIFEIMELGYAGNDTMDEFEARLGWSRVHKSLDISKLRVQMESLKVQTCSKFSVVMDACADKVELHAKEPLSYTQARSPDMLDGASCSASSRAGEAKTQTT